MGSEYWEIFRLFLGTGLRYGEAFNRTAEDLEGNILVIRHNTDAEWRTKTSSSVRRVPLDDRAVRAFKAILQRNLIPPTWNQYLNREIRRFFDDPRLVLHSTRHTYKTLCRVTGVEINIVEEISGHAKSRVSKTSDGYGEYPDEVLIKENSKVW